jgi:hypothetical protein
MLGHLVEDLPVAVEMHAGRLHAADLVALVRAEGVPVVCIADLPPSPSSKTRYLVQRLHAALPDLHIAIGRWAPAALADDGSQVLRTAGASLVASSLLETRTYLEALSRPA